MNKTFEINVNQLTIIIFNNYLDIFNNFYLKKLV